MAVSVVDNAASSGYNYDGNTALTDLTLSVGSAILAGIACSAGSLHTLDWNSVTGVGPGYGKIGRASWWGRVYHVLVDDAIDEGTDTAIYNTAAQGSGIGVSAAVAGVKTDSMNYGYTSGVAFDSAVADFTNGINIGTLLCGESLGTLVTGTLLSQVTWSAATVGGKVIYQNGNGSFASFSNTSHNGAYNTCTWTFEPISGLQKFVPMIGANFAFLLAAMQVVPSIARFGSPLARYMQYFAPPAILTGKKVIMPYFDYEVEYGEVLDRMKKPLVYMPEFLDPILIPLYA